MAKRSKKKQVPDSEVSPKVTTASAGVQRPLPSWFHRDSLWGPILVLSVMLTYTPVWHAGFIWDGK